MYTASFIFDKKQFDDVFYQLDKEIAEFAKNTSGYLGVESWVNTDTGLITNVYYWQTMDGLKELMNHPKHLEAKASQSNWLNGYQVVISQVIRAYGDGKIAHPTSSLNHT